MSTPVSPNAKVEMVSDLAAAEREVEAYLKTLTQSGCEPESCVPFSLDKPAASAAFAKWLGGLSLVPGDLTKTAELGELKPVYVPFWAVSAMTYTKYHGERGEDYQDTEYYTDAGGNSANRQVTKMSWTAAQGEVRHNFENVTLCGVTLPDDRLALLAPKDVRGVQPYRGGDAAVQRSGLDPRAAFNKVRTQIEAEVKKLVEKDIGGKQQKVTKMETRHVGVALKQVLVPAWEGTYRYKGKDYKVLLHGGSGAAVGEYPVSAGKVLLTVGIVLGIFAAICAAVWFFVIAPRLKKTAEVPTRPAAVATADCWAAPFRGELPSADSPT